MKKYLLALFVLLSAFATKAQTNEYSIYSQENGMKNKGRVIGTITINSCNCRRSIYRVIFKAKNPEIGKTFIGFHLKRTKRKKPNPDYWDGDKAVYVVVWDREAGEYYFSSVDAFIKFKDISEAVKFPFTVNENEITYFGNIEIDTDDVNENVVVSKKDKRDRDFFLVLKKYPDSFWKKFKNGDIILNATAPVGM